jgi:NAD(P)-dependent dehydrogenase (short-subunit alcohol dehydrogenase family)
MRLRDKVAFVTGAGGGIGQAVCQRFLAEGARVAATDIDPAAADAAIAGSDADQVIAIACDAGISEDVRAAIAQAVTKFGQLDVLCGIAGGSSTADGGVTDAPEEEFWRVIRTDLFGPFVLCKYGIPELIKSGGGSVITMTSMTAMIGTTGRDCYTAAKGGVVAMTRSIATGYGQYGIRVNAIAPGMTRTPRVMARPSTPAREALAARHLLGLVEPNDIAEMAVYLGSDESRVVTGQVLRVDSGATMH